MRAHKIITVTATILALVASPAMASNNNGGCDNVTIQTPNNAPVQRTKSVVVGSTGATNHWDGQIERCEINGHIFLLPTGCTAPASLTGAEFGLVYGNVGYTTLDGNVPDLPGKQYYHYEYRYGQQVKVLDGPVQSGSCSH